jgi:hypothetical protein
MSTGNDDNVGQVEWEWRFDGFLETGAGLFTAQGVLMLVCAFSNRLAPCIEQKQATDRLSCPLIDFLEHQSCGLLPKRTRQDRVSPFREWKKLPTKSKIKKIRLQYVG